MKLLNPQRLQRALESSTFNLRSGHAGGGAALLHLSEFVPNFANSLEDAEEKLGAEIVRKALLCPARLIANNAGFEGDVIVESLLGKPFEFGYNAVRVLVSGSVQSNCFL